MNLEKWEPCEACKRGFSVMAEKYNATQLVFSPEDKPPTIGAYGDDEAEAEVAYCPKCGRPLTEEAGKLLEKRIASCNLTEDEISFLVECVKMAEQESFYVLDCFYNDFDVEKVGVECLRKIGVKEKDIKYCFDPRPQVIRGRGEE